MKDTSHGLHNRLDPLDEGHRAAYASDAEWSAILAARRRDLIGALAETVLDGPLEHTAIDLALADAVRSVEVLILPMVVDRILSPSPEDDEAWRIMAYPALLRRMDAQCQLARHYVIANMLVLHKLSDLANVDDSGFAMRALASSSPHANAEKHIAYRLAPGSGPARFHGERARTQPNRAEAAAGARHRSGAQSDIDRSFVVQHQLHLDELAAFGTTARMASGIR